MDVNRQEAVAGRFAYRWPRPTPPTPIEIPADSNVEMSWHVFGGEYHELYLALLKERWGASTGSKPIPIHSTRQLHLHLPPRH